MKTDIAKTLEILQKSGQRGIHSFELNNAIGTTRAAARIQDLKNLGYVISATHEKYGDSWGVRYFLLSQPQKQAPVLTSKVQEKAKPIRYEFVGGYARPIYA